MTTTTMRTFDNKRLKGEKKNDEERKNLLVINDNHCNDYND